ncbi:MAG: hypothetical protein M1457_06240, partial [bacterium]|nr:hypothetical protein [bacterium]
MARGISGLATLWWPLPLALWTIGLRAALPGAPRLTWRALGWLLLALAPLAVRARLSLHGPLPAAGLREALGFAVAAVTAVALWFFASAQPGKALLLWMGVLLVGGFTAAFVTGRFSRLDPPQVAAFASVGVALVIGAGAWSNQPWRELRTGPHAPRAADREGRSFVGWFGFAILKGCLLAGGMLMARWALGSLKGLGDLPAVEVDRGLQAVGMLWVKSILFGWGSGSAGRLAQVFSDPYPALIPPWSGLIGTLAAGGLTGLVFYLAWGCYLIWRPAWDRAGGASSYRPLSLAAMPAALFVLG